MVECPPGVREVAGSMSGRVMQNSLKLYNWIFLLDIGMNGPVVLMNISSKCRDISEKLLKVAATTSYKQH